MRSGRRWTAWLVLMSALAFDCGDPGEDVSGTGPDAGAVDATTPPRMDASTNVSDALVPSMDATADASDAAVPSMDASTDASDADVDAAAMAEAGCADAGPTHAVLDAAAFVVAGDPGNAPAGYGDPSVAYAVGADAGFMTYTAVGPGVANTRYAKSTDHGATFTYLGEVNASTSLVITTNDNSVCGSTVCLGKWIHEVSTLIEDPTDIPSRRFKVFAHSYFSGSGGLRYDIGSIDLWTTSSMTAGAVWTESRVLGWNSSSPRSSTGVSVNLTTDPAMAPYFGSCFAVSEPGAIARGSTIDLVLGCLGYVSPTNIPIEMVMIRSTDHGATWKPVAKLLDTADATALGAQGPRGPQINGGDLFQSNGVTYLFASPNGPVTNFLDTTGYRGCVAIPFADVDAGVLRRCDGKLVVTDTFQAPPGVFNGGCTYREGASAAGVMGLTADVNRTVPFQLFATGVAVP